MAVTSPENGDAVAGGSGVHGEGAPVVPGHGEDHHEVRHVAANFMVWSTTRCASWGGDATRTELPRLRRAPVVEGDDVPVVLRARGEDEEVRRDTGKMMEAAASAWASRNDGVVWTWTRWCRRVLSSLLRSF